MCKQSKAALVVVGVICVAVGVAGMYGELSYPSECELLGSATAARIWYVALCAAVSLGGALLILWPRVGWLVLAGSFFVGGVGIVIVRCVGLRLWEQVGGSLLMLLVALAAWRQKRTAPCCGDDG